MVWVAKSSSYLDVPGSGWVAKSLGEQGTLGFFAEANGEGGGGGRDGVKQVLVDFAFDFDSPFGELAGPFAVGGGEPQCNQEARNS